MGSIGEVIAKERYGLELLPSSSERHDARTVDGKMVKNNGTLNWLFADLKSKQVEVGNVPQLF